MVRSRSMPGTALCVSCCSVLRCAVPQATGVWPCWTTALMACTCCCACPSARHARRQQTTRVSSRPRSAWRTRWMLSDECDECDAVSCQLLTSGRSGLDHTLKGRLAAFHGRNRCHSTVVVQTVTDCLVTQPSRQGTCRSTNSSSAD